MGRMESLLWKNLHRTGMAKVYAFDSRTRNALTTLLACAFCVPGTPSSRNRFVFGRNTSAWGVAPGSGHGRIDNGSCKGRPERPQAGSFFRAGGRKRTELKNLVGLGIANTLL